MSEGNGNGKVHKEVLAARRHRVLGFWVTFDLPPEIDGESPTDREAGLNITNRAHVNVLMGLRDVCSVEPIFADCLSIRERFHIYGLGRQVVRRKGRRSPKELEITEDRNGIRQNVR